MLPDPLVAAPFKISRNETEARRRWLRSNAWPIDIEPMTKEHAVWWDASVQPTIQRVETERLLGLRPDPQPRADAYWRFGWETVWRVFGAARWVPSGPGPMSLRRTRPQLWAISTTTAFGEVRPIGLLLGLSGFELPPGGPVGSHHFTWLLTAAPEDTLNALGVPTGLALGRVLVDTVLQISLATGSRGRVLLHADPMGGPGLLRFYEDVMMIKLDLLGCPRISMRRTNDGRYFLFDQSRAGAFSLQLSPYRLSILGTISERYGAFPVKPRVPMP